MLVNGNWNTEAKGSVTADGNFVRPDSSFRKKVTFPGEGEFPAEAHRYNLVVSYACPWAHRTILYRALLNLEEIIDLSIVNPISYPDGWTFRNYKNVKNATGEDTLFLRDLYTAQDPNFTGKVTVPILWDKKTRVIVNNESSEIIRMLDGPFSTLNGNEPNRMITTFQKDEIESLNNVIYQGINNCVYRAGFATSQSAYEDSINLLFQTLEKIENQLAKNDFLLGDKPCEADWRLFPTLIRFDTVYYYHFKCNKQKLSSYPNITSYLEKLLSIPKVKNTIDKKHIIEHYYLSHVKLNPFGIIPVGALAQSEN